MYWVVLLDKVRPDLWKSLSLKNRLFWQKSGLFCLQISANTDISAQRWVLLSTVCPDSFESIAPIARKNSHKLILLLLDYVVSLNLARQLGAVMKGMQKIWDWFNIPCPWNSDLGLGSGVLMQIGQYVILLYFATRYLLFFLSDSLGTCYM